MKHAFILALALTACTQTPRGNFELVRIDARGEAWVEDHGLTLEDCAGVMRQNTNLNYQCWRRYHAN